MSVNHTKLIQEHHPASQEASTDKFMQEKLLKKGKAQEQGKHEHQQNSQKPMDELDKQGKTSNPQLSQGNQVKRLISTQISTKQVQHPKQSVPVR